MATQLRISASERKKSHSLNNSSRPDKKNRAGRGKTAIAAHSCRLDFENCGPPETAIRAENQISADE